MAYQKRDTSSGGSHPLVDVVAAFCGPHLGAFIVAFIFMLCLWTLVVHWSIVAPQLLYSTPSFGIFLVAMHQYIHWGVVMSLYNAVRTDPGYVEKDFSPELKAQQDKLEGRICLKCPCFKPERTHHCSQCNRCVLKMDHHCVFVNNCVGMGNYKFFVLLLVYTAIGGVWNAYCDYCWLYSGPSKSRDPQVIVMSNAIVILVVGFILAPFAIFHVYLAARNTTTLEALKGKIGVHDQDILRNLRQAFGRRWWLWLSPVHPAWGGADVGSRASDPLLPPLDLEEGQHGRRMDSA